LLKVLQISNKAPYPCNDGSSIAIYNMARGLLENGVELHLLTINTKKHFKPDSGVPHDFLKRTHYQSVYRDTDLSFPEAFMNLFSSQSYFVSRFKFREFENKLAGILKEQKFDIIQLEGLFMAVYIGTIRKFSTAKIVLRAHNIEHFIWKRHITHENSWIKRLYLRLQNRRLRKFELKIMNSVDALVPITTTDEEEFKKLGCTKPLFSCISGVDVPGYQASGPVAERPGSVFYFGSMDWLPNQEAVSWFLKNCWKDIISAVPSAKFIIAGRGIPLHFFHNTLPNVSIIEDVEVPSVIFRQNQVMIVPLWSGSGLRIKIIEGMAYGKPIVSTSIGAEGIAYTAGKELVIADDSASFSAAVISLLTDDAKRNALSEAASSFAMREFNNKPVVERLVNFYRGLMNG
jgi:polysaccharide biosynthesis protein PslH